MIEEGIAVLRAQIKTLPAAPGTYRMLAADGGVLYVGKAKNLRNRVASYTQISRLPVRLQRMVARTRGLEIVTTRTEAEALLLEANLIQQFLPPYNVLLRDDKSFPFILITQDHPFPQLLKHRGAKTRKGLYFGPFASGGAVTETLGLLARAFMLRTCSDNVFAGRSRPCLQYHIKRCTAPCVGKVDEAAYGRQVRDACAFLRGQSQALQREMADEMQKASEALDYERAAFLRDRIRVLTSVQARQDIDLAGLGDADVIALYRAGGRSAVQVFFYRADRNCGTKVYFPSHDGQTETGEILAAFLGQFYAGLEPPPQIFLSEEPDNTSLLQEALSQKAGRKVRLAVSERGRGKRLVTQALANARAALGRKVAEATEQKKLLVRVAELFGLKKPPERIEVYDNSHLSGAFAVGAMIVAGPEGFLKKNYRKFNIRSARTDDDFAMMQEVLSRRFKRLLEEDPKRRSNSWPDLLLIDGGAGQLGRVQKVLEDLGVSGVAVVGIAKGPDRNAGRERFFIKGKQPLTLPPDDPVLYYLQRLRDEAHRFAVGAHRARRTCAIDVTGLEDIPGVGAARKKALLRVFGSGRAVAGAGAEELARVSGVSAALAQKIYDYFHEKG